MKTLAAEETTMPRGGKLAGSAGSHFASPGSAVLRLLLILTVAPLAVDAQTNCLPLFDGVVSWWPGEGNGSDVVGTNDATLVNGVSFAAGQVGQAFSFNGINQYAEVPDVPSLDPTSGITVEAWVYPLAPPPDAFTIVSKDGVSTERQYLLNIASLPQGQTVLRALVGVQAGFAVLTGNQAVPLNTWTHVALAYDGSRLQLYVNGVLDADMALRGPLITSTQPLLIGSSVAGYPFEGRIDEVTLYARSLSPLEIQAIYNAGSAGKCSGNTAPFILVQPTNQTIFETSTTSFTVTAGGTPTLQYQWNLDGTNLPGANQATLTLTNAQFSQAGNYTVVVTDAFGMLTSSTAVLTVNPAPPCTAIPAGLVSWWPAEGNGADVIGTNAGTLVNGVDFAPGVVGRAFAFAGSQYVEIADSPSLNPARGLTLEGWVFPTESASVLTIASKDDGYSSREFLLNVVPSPMGQPVLQGNLWLQSGFQAVQGSSAVPTNKWTHVAMAYDGSSLSLYVNGNLDAAVAAQGFITATPLPLIIGAGAAGSNYNFIGLIDELSFYRRGLSPTEVESIYNSGLIGKCLSNTSPFIFVQPTNLTVYLGDSGGLSVIAGGTPPLTYQWTFNGVDIPRAAQSSLALTNVQPAQAGAYTVRVSNPVSALVSSNAVLTVSPIPSCIPAPNGLVSWWPAEGDASDLASTNSGTLTGNTTFGPGIIGQAFVFDGTGSGVIIGNPTNLQLQNFTIEGWIKRGSASSVSLSGPLGFIFSYGAGGYGLAVGNDGSLALTDVGVSSISSPAVITDTNFHHVAVTKRDGTVNFYVDGTQYPVGVYDPAFTFSTPAAIGTLSNTGPNGFLGAVDELSIYNRALSSAEMGTLFFLGALAKCLPQVAPFIVIQPTNQTVFASRSAGFSVFAGGSRSLVYQWAFNGTNIPGATQTSLLITNLQPSQAGIYTVAVSNSFGTILSSNAVLTVNPLPGCITPPAGLVSWWPAEGDASDLVGGNGGTLTGNTTFGLGYVGQAFVFDGTGSGVIVGNPTNLQLQDFTIEAWIERGSGSSVSRSAPLGFIFGYGFGGYGLAVGSDGSLVLTDVGVSSVSSPALVTDTAFHHVAVTKTGSLVAFYVDGAQYPAGAYDPAFTFSTRAAIGTISDAGQDGFLGTIDELSIYSRALSPGELQTLYLLGFVGKCWPPAAPVIVIQPTNQTVFASRSASFSVAVSGSRPLVFQWALNGTNIPGATLASLLLTNIQPAQAGSYTVTVSNSAGTVLSSNALLTVNLLPPCTIPPVGLVSWWAAEGNASDQVGGNSGTLTGNTAFGPGYVGQAFVFDGTGSGVIVGNPTNLQLQDFTIEAWVKRSSGTGISLSGPLGFIFGYGAGGYGLALGSDGSLVLTDVGVSSVNSPALITDTGFHHVAVTKSGSAVNFYVDGAQYPVGAYNPGFTFLTQAALGTIGVTGQDGFLGTIDELSIYSRGLSSAEIGAIYHSGPAGKCTGEIAPFIFLQPTNQTVYASQPASFTVIASGTTPLTYQWALNGTNITGATQTSLLLTNVQPAQAGSYTVTVSNSASTVLSSNAVLTVNPLPPCTIPPVGLVSWWPAEGNASDQVGGNRGNLTGNTTFGPGYVGQAFVFDGTGSGVIVGNPANLQLQDFTIEAWIKRGSGTGISLSGPLGFIFGYGPGGYGLALGSDGSLVLTDVGVSSVSSPALVTDTNFHYVAVTKSGSAVNFYVDGAPYPVGAYNPGFTFSTPAAIGTISDTGPDGFLGAIDELSIYSRALSTTELGAIYRSGPAGKCVGTTAPFIFLQPTNQTVYASRPAGFMVIASGTAPLAYQWALNGTNIIGATQTSLLLTNVQPAQAGSYTVTVSNSIGNVLSSNAVLTVNPLPPCTIPPVGLVSWWAAEGNASDQVGGNSGTLTGNTAFGPGYVGQAFVFDGTGSGVIVGNPADLQLQDFTIEAWIKRGSGTGISLSGPLGFIFGYGAGGYGLALGSDGSLVLTDVGVSSVNSPALITDTGFHHVAVTKSGSAVNFYVDGAQYPVGAYNPGFTFLTQAALGTIGVTGQDGFLGTIDELSIYSRGLSSAEIGAIYHSGPAGKCMGEIAPFIFLQPTNQTVYASRPAGFMVIASGTAPLTYQWALNGTNITGATQTSLLVTNVQPAQAGIYTVAVSNSLGSVVSSNAVLTVNPLPPCIIPPGGLVSWWPAEGNASDLVGGNNGTLTGNTTFGPGYVGQAFVFDGTGSGVIVGNPTNLQLQAFTIEAWVKRGSSSSVSLSGPLGFIFGYGPGGYGLALGSDGSLVLTKVGVSSVSSPPLVTDTNFHHLGVTKVGIGVIFYMDGVQYPVGAYDPGFTFSTPAAIGTISDTGPDGFLGTIDELSIYLRALSADDMQTLYSIGVLGKCMPPAPPFIVAQPASQTLTNGDTAQFSVVAGGTSPLVYQWFFNGASISGATDASLTWTNVQRSQAGAYGVLVTNNYGSVTSSVAVLAVNFGPAGISLTGVSTASGDTVSVPVNLAANGNEHLMTFSLWFDPGLLVYSNAVLTQEAAGAALLVDSSQASSGHLGFALAFAGIAGFTPGTHQVIRLTFTAGTVTNTGVAGLSFADSPMPRQLLDAQGDSLPATYTGGAVSIAAIAYEGDVYPRPSGDRALTIADWVLEGQYAAGLDYPTNEFEFQRADCAPRASAGNGAITVADWVQVGRYVLGLDPLTPVGGPLMEIPYTGPGPSPTRTLTAGTVTLSTGQTSVVTLTLAAQGNENGLGFSLLFDPALVSLTSVLAGPDAAGATIYVNTNNAGSGQIGLVLALNPGLTFQAGTRAVVQVGFRASAAASGNFAPVFADSPVIREVCDATALALPASFIDPSNAGTPSPSLTISRSGPTISVSWPLSGTNFVLQETLGNFPLLPVWTNTVGAPAVTGSNNVETLPLGTGTKFFRLFHP